MTREDIILQARTAAEKVHGSQLSPETVEAAVDIAIVAASKIALKCPDSHWGPTIARQIIELGRGK